MKTPLFKRLLVATLLLGQLSTKAEDIDLFVSAPPAGSGVPNVLFILDSTANWNTAFTAEITALKKVFDEMPTNADGSAKFNVGLMMFAESPVKGGYMRAAIRPMTGTTAVPGTKQQYGALINSFDKIADKGANALYAYTMAEAYRYFMGIQEYVGADEPKRDYSSNPTGTAQSIAVHALSGNAFSDAPAISDKIYNKPASVDGCAKNFIIYISNGKVDSSDKEGTNPQCNTTDKLKSCTAQQLLNQASGKTFGTDYFRIPISPSGEANNMSDEWAKFLKESSLGVTTYTVDVGTPDTDHTALLKSMANVSKGIYYSASAASSSDIAAKINQALTEIQAVNSVFASVSLPVSVSTQGNYRNQVFIGMFRPDADGYPRWNGNLKQYKLGYDTSLNDGVLRLLYDNADSSPTASLSAINNSTGFITGCARSFWTPTTVDTYWATRPELNCLTVANSDVSNYPDGNVVEKGAQGYKLRAGVTRTVKTCSSVFTSCTSLLDFNTTNVTQANLGAANATEQGNLVNWAQGQDVQNEDLDLVTTAEMRMSAHGDVVHSRPMAINFGTDASPQVVVYYGGNDGMLRAINGNRSAAIGSFAAGAELWSFMPPEFFPAIKRIYDNSPQISFPTNTSVTPTPLPKRYGMDGPIVGYKGASATWIYGSMRRGGRALYAFEVTNASPAAAPTLKWKRGCSNNFKDVRTGLAADRGVVDDLVADACTSGTPGDWSGIGQTWSAPTVVTAAGYNDGATPTPAAKPMLIMGGGYDTCQDADPNSGCSSSSKGTKIYVLDADTGNLLRTFNTASSVVAELTVVPDDQGLAKYIYAVDLGGNVYRISGATAGAEIGSTAPDSWTMTKIAVLGGTGTDNRKFMFRPDIVVNSTGGYSILAGSGDREKPLLSYTAAASVTNYFFMLVDKPTVSTWLTDESSNCGGNYLCLSSLFGIAWNDSNPTTAQLSANKGWYLGLRPNEQVVTSAITVFDNVTFSTQRPYGSTPAEPQPDGQPYPACGSNLGTAKVYNVNYANAGALPGESRSSVIVGGGLPPSPVAGMVKLDNGQVVPFIIGGKGTSSLEGGSPPAPSSAVRPKSRAYWYIQK